MATFGEFLDHFCAEGRQIIWLARGDETIVDDHLAVHPVGASVPEVGFERWPGSHLLGHGPGIDQRPRRPLSEQSSEREAELRFSGELSGRF